MTEKYKFELVLRVPIIDKDGARWLVDTGCPYSYPIVKLPRSAEDRHEIKGIRLLGHDSFRRYTKIDYAHREIVFSDDPIELDGTVVHMSQADGCWKVPMTVGGSAHDYILDTGAAYSYVHNLTNDIPPAERVEDSGLSGRVWNATVRMAPATFVGNGFEILCADALDNMEGSRPGDAVPLEGVIGYEFFANFTVVVDKGTCEMIFKRA